MELVLLIISLVKGLPCGTWNSDDNWGWNCGCCCMFWFPPIKTPPWTFWFICWFGGPNIFVFPWLALFWNIWLALFPIIPKALIWVLLLFPNGEFDALLNGELALFWLNGEFMLLVWLKGAVILFPPKKPPWLFGLNMPWEVGREFFWPAELKIPAELMPCWVCGFGNIPVLCWFIPVGLAPNTPWFWVLLAGLEINVLKEAKIPLFVSAGLELFAANDPKPPELYCMLPPMPIDPVCPNILVGPWALLLVEGLAEYVNNY